MMCKIDEDDVGEESCLLVTNCLFKKKIIYIFGKLNGWHATNFGVLNAFPNRTMKRHEIAKIQRYILKADNRCKDVMNLPSSLCVLEDAGPIWNKPITETVQNL